MEHKYPSDVTVDDVQVVDVLETTSNVHQLMQMPRWAKYEHGHSTTKRKWLRTSFNLEVLGLLSRYFTMFSLPTDSKTQA